MADDATRSATPADDPLAWEAQNMRRAGLAAAAAAALTLVGSVVAGLANAGAPRGDARVLTLVDTLGRAASGRPAPPGQLATVYEYQGEHAPTLILGALLVGLGTLALFPPLAYLYRAARARGQVPRFALIAAAVGAVGAGLGQAVSQTAFALTARGFANGADHTNSAALDVRSEPLFLAGGFLAEIAGLALAVAFLLICLNAMRVGLLSRFMGVVGMFVGATLVIRQFDPFGIVRSFWLAALAMLILGRLPRGRPPAWAVAEAVPWPTQQEVREQREAARRARGEPERPARRRGPAPPASADDDGAPKRGAKVPAPRAPQPRREDASPGRPHPSSKKRKRKRRS